MPCRESLRVATTIGPELSSGMLSPRFTTTCASGVSIKKPLALQVVLGLPSWKATALERWAHQAAARKRTHIVAAKARQGRSNTATPNDSPRLQIQTPVRVSTTGSRQKAVCCC